MFRHYKMQEIAAKFAEQYVYKHQDERSHRTLSHHQEKIKLVLESSFAYCEPSKITTDVLIDIFLRLGDDASLNTRILCEFLCYTASTRLISFDGQYNFLSYYQLRFAKKPKAVDVVYLLQNTELFEKLIKSQMHLDSIGDMVSFQRAALDSFLEPETGRAINRFLNSIKLEQGLSNLSKNSQCCESKRVLTAIFKEVVIHNLERFQLGNLIRVYCDRSSKAEQKLTFKYVYRFINYLLNEEFYPDGRFTYLRYYSEYFESNGVNNYFYELLISKHPFQYRVAKLQNGQLAFVFINGKTEEVCEIVAETFGIYTHNFECIKNINNNFDTTISPLLVSNTEDFSFKTFQTQVEYLRINNYPREAFSYIVTLYSVIAQKYNSHVFRDAMIDSAILTRTDLAKLLFDGFEIVSYNPAEAAPRGDRLLIHIYGKEDVNSTSYPSKSKAIEFARVHCAEYKELLKDYLWHAAPAFNTKIIICQHAISFFQYLERLQNHEEFSIYYGTRHGIEILAKDGLAYSMYLRETQNKQSTRYAYLKDTSLLLQYAVENNYPWVDRLGIRYLTTYSSNQNSANPISDDELDRLCASVNDKSEVDMTRFVCSSIFYLLITTELRISEILNLDVDCVVETMKNNEFVLVSKKKTSNREYVQTPISIYTKEELDRVKVRTQSWRVNCLNQSIQGKLFIIPAHRKNAYRRINEHFFNSYLRDCCKQAGIAEYTAQNLRDVHMNKAQEMKRRKGLSDMKKAILTGHEAPNTDDLYYLKDDIITLLEAVYGIIIGDVPIAGQVKDHDDTLGNEALVSGKCGYCAHKNCDSFSYVDCLLCKHFVATKDRMCFFDQEIRRIDYKLKTETIPHEIESLKSIKRLLLGYLARLMSLEASNGTSVAN